MPLWESPFAFGLMWPVFVGGRLSIATWVISAFEITVILAVWWRLHLRWSFEQNRVAALASTSLLTATALFPLWVKYALGSVPHQTPDQFQMIIRMQSHYDAWGLLLSVIALVSVIIWRRSSKYFASNLALSLGIWMCLLRTWISIMSD
jgi:hypothetical protein